MKNLQLSFSKVKEMEIEGGSSADVVSFLGKLEAEINSLPS